MKKYFIVFYITILCSYSFAQKIDKEKLGLYQVTSYPEKPLPKEFSTYKVEVKSSDEYVTQFIDNFIDFQGYQKLDFIDTIAPDLIFKFQVLPFQTTKPQSSSSVSTRTNKDGTVTKTTYYYYECKMKYSIKYYFLDKNDVIYKKGDLSGNSTISTQSTTSYKMAYNELNSRIENQPQYILKNNLSTLLEFINDQYGFPIRKHSLLSYNIKVKKKCKFDYKEIITAFEAQKQSFEIVKENQDQTEQYLEKMNQAISIWENALSESDIKNRKARINKDITLAMYYNLGVTFFVAKNYDKANNYFLKCMEIKKSFSDASSLSKLAVKYQKRIDTYNSPDAKTITSLKENIEKR